MTRAFLTLAGALLATGTLLSTAAEACISCEYVPEVVRNHTTDRPASAGSYSHRASSYAAHQESKSRRIKRLAKSDEPKKQQKVAKTEKIEKKEPKLAKAERKEPKVAKASNADREPVKVARAEPTPAKVQSAAKKVAESESSSITVASVETTAAAVTDAVENAAAKPTDCKKFFASVGMTLTVPCE
jgi:flagellar biosynthesis GTPase FlhF